MSACLDMQEHIASLYADDYLKEQSETLTPQELKWFHESWAEELAKKGTFDRFDVVCFRSLKPSQYNCAMQAMNTNEFLACIHFE